MSYPRTLITNDPEEVMGFSRTYGRPIYKSMSSIRSKVRQLGDIKMSQLENVRSLPTQFQTLVPGTNVRVHVVGEEVFATEVISEAIDYRYAFEVGSQVELKPTSLPNHIKEICSFLSRSLELPLCGIDLKRTLEDEYYCFEVNPSPGFSYYQEGSGQDIASAIVDYLSINGRDLKNERDMNMEVFDAGDRELD